MSDFKNLNSLPPSHAAWITVNGEVSGIDPSFSIEPVVDKDAMARGIEVLKSLGCTFYRWTKVGGAGVLDGWLVRPARQGRVGYGARITDLKWGRQHVA